VGCPACTGALLKEGKDREMEVKEDYRGKLKYQGESGKEAWPDHCQVMAFMSENEPGKLN